MNDAGTKSARSGPSGQGQRRGGAGRAIGATVGKWRDAVAGALVALGVTPNMLTVAGTVLTGVASVCLIVGAGHAPVWEANRAVGTSSWWPLWTAIVLTVAFACDMLDGAVARIGNLRSDFGAFLDSTLDRFSDLFIFGGCAIHFAYTGNVTCAALSITAAANGVLISYVKARAENFVDDCGVGYWQRGERCGLFLAGACFGHIPAALWLLGTLPITTVIRRIAHTHHLLEHALKSSGDTGHSSSLRDAPAVSSPLAGATPRPTPLAQGGKRVVERRTGMETALITTTSKRLARGAVGYDACTALALAFIIAAPLFWRPLTTAHDPLGTLLERLFAV